ncbi:hypothetical protein NMS_1678 [Nonlabens marinus S1-08]|uniref:Uncharacterized protein n=1 Tax=Nonlabens marinus S1-08 TaxID=1454201 RepID=W8VXC5_9FLAO|nr:hypothetical protein NMS_1678 [Nonlabens marinus S1-08]
MVELFSLSRKRKYPSDFQFNNEVNKWSYENVFVNWHDR